MTNFFDRLIARTTGDGVLLQPRSPTRFGTDPAEEQAGRLDYKPPAVAWARTAIPVVDDERGLVPGDEEPAARPPAAWSVEDGASVQVDREASAIQPQDGLDQGRAALPRSTRSPTPGGASGTRGPRPGEDGYHGTEQRPFREEPQLGNDTSAAERSNARAAQQPSASAAEPIERTSVAPSLPDDAVLTPGHQPLNGALNHPVPARAASSAAQRHTPLATLQARDAPTSPVIIEIGSIEFHAPPSPATPAAPPPAPRRPELSLGDYLARRAGGGR